MKLRIVVALLFALPSLAQSQLVPYELRGIPLSIGEPEAALRERFSRQYLMEYTRDQWTLKCRERDITGTTPMFATINIERGRVNSITEYMGDECGKYRSFPWSAADGLEKASNALLKMNRFTGAVTCVVGRESDVITPAYKGFTIKCGRYLLSAQFNPELLGSDLVMVTVK